MVLGEDVNINCYSRSRRRSFVEGMMLRRNHSGLVFVLSSFIVCVQGSLASSLSKENGVFEECFEGDQFLAIDQELDFEAAKLTCLGQGGFLARISNRQEHEFVGAFLNAIDEIAGNSKFWIGIEDVNQTGGRDPSRFSFVDGEKEGVDFFELGGLFPWQSGQPNDVDGVQDCVQ